MTSRRLLDRPPARTMTSWAWRQPSSSPHLVGHLHDPPQLRPLLLLGEDIAFLGRGEAALRREAELVERDELRRLLDATLELVFRLEAAALGGDEAEHHHL